MISSEGSTEDNEDWLRDKVHSVCLNEEVVNWGDERTWCRDRRSSCMSLLHFMKISERDGNGVSLTLFSCTQNLDSLAVGGFSSPTLDIPLS